MPPRAVIVPVKATAQAKSRLVVPGRPADDAARIRAELARAMAADTIAVACATLGVDEVVVVTADATVASMALQAGARRVPDAGSLNASLEAAAGTLPDLDLVVLPMDLVGVGAADLGACLALVDGPPVERVWGDGVRGEAVSGHGAVAGHRKVGDWFVPDTTGTGTTLVGRAAGSGRAFAYGPRSAARHCASGFRRLRLPPDLSRIHRDVDDLVSLWAVAPGSTGPCVGAVLARYGLVPAAQGVRAGTREEL